jgi:hypothetical protein
LSGNTGNRREFAALAPFTGHPASGAFEPKARVASLSLKSDRGGRINRPPSDREARELTTVTNNPDVITLALVIARSPIVVSGACSDARRFPAGFDVADIAILEWIATEAGHAGQFVRM